MKGYLSHCENVINDRGDEFEVTSKLLYILISRAKEKVILFSDIGHTTRKNAPLDHTIELENIIFSDNKDSPIKIITGYLET